MQPDQIVAQLSNEQEGQYAEIGAFADGCIMSSAFLELAEVACDPTGWTLSKGNILRTQKDSEGAGR